MLLGPRVWLRNSLAFPIGRAPGFNPSHPAGQNIRFSAVACVGGGFLNTLDGTHWTMNGSPTSGIFGTIGPRNSFATGASYSVSGKPAITDANATQAAVIHTGASVSSYQTWIASSSSSSGWKLGNNASGHLEITAAGVAEHISGIVLAINTPYFVLASVTPSSNVFVSRNLFTGQITTNTAGSTGTSNASNGGYYLGNDSSNTFTQAAIGCGMFSGVALSMAQALAFANDFWSFWYPANPIEKQLIVGGIYAAPVVKKSPILLAVGM